MDISCFDKLDTGIIIPNIHEYFLPGIYANTYYTPCGDGYLLFVNMLRWTRCLIIGDIDWDELSKIVSGNRIIVYYQIPKCPWQDCKGDRVDFIIDDSVIDIHKYDIKNSIKRKMADIEVCEDEYLFPEEYDLLFRNWVRPEMRPHLFKDHIRWMQNENEYVQNISYRYKGQLIGHQTFFKVCGGVYFITNVFDKANYSQYSPIAWSYPIHKYGKIHYLGAYSKDTGLMLHKDRVCKDEYVSFATTTFTDKSDVVSEIDKIKSQILIP